MGTYKVPDDYDYTTGGFLERDKHGKVKPRQLTPEKLNRVLFPHLISESSDSDDDEEEES